MSSRHCDVLVVGAGPVGLTAAAELRRRGVGVRCVDAAVHHNVSTKALGLQARTLELFERLGVIDEVVARGMPVRKFNILSEEHPIAHFDLGGLDTPYPYLLMLPQNITEEILRDRLFQLGGLVEHGTELVAFGQDAGGVDAVLRSDGRTETVRANWLIAADGAHSTVRHGLELQFEGGRFREDFTVADIQVDWSLPMDELFAFLNHGDFIAYFPMVGGWHRVAVAHNTAPAPSGEVTLGEVQDAIDRCGPHGARAVQIGDRSRFVINQRTVEKQSVGRIFLAGDAAHVNSVVGAQGLNIGVQDSFNLAWKLAAVSGAKAAPELLDTYAGERRPAATRIVKGTTRATRMTLLRPPLTVFARRRLAPLLLRRARVRSGVEHALSQLDISYRRPGAAITTGGPVLAGDRAPDAPLRPLGTAPTPAVTRLFEVIKRDEFSLLVVCSAKEAAARYDSIQRVTAEFPLVRPFLVLPDAEPVQRSVNHAATMLADVAGTLRAKYHIDDEAVLLIRPDGYLAFRQDHWAPIKFGQYLRRWLTSTVSMMEK